MKKLKKIQLTEENSMVENQTALTVAENVPEDEVENIDTVGKAVEYIKSQIG